MYPYFNVISMNFLFEFYFGRVQFRRSAGHKTDLQSEINSRIVENSTILSQRRKFFNQYKCLNSRIDKTIHKTFLVNNNTIQYYSQDSIDRFKLK